MWFSGFALIKSSKNVFSLEMKVDKKWKLSFSLKFNRFHEDKKRKEAGRTDERKKKLKR